MATTEKVLLVDDDPNVLQAYQRRLRRQFDVETALCSEEGVTAVDILGPFAVVVSDMKMPRENGAEFLSRILRRAPESVRIMLTGNADQQTAADAVNIGQVFRFLNKPCPAEELEAAIQQGIDEHHRLCAERKLVSQTVDGVVSMLTKMLALASPEAFGRSERLRQLAGELADAAELNGAWDLEIAAALSQLGAMCGGGAGLSGNDGYSVASELIAEAPRLTEVATLVGTLGSRGAVASSERMKLQADLLRLAIAFDEGTSAGASPIEALQAIDANQPVASSEAHAALRKVVARRDQRRLVYTTIDQLEDGMQLAADVTTDEGMMLVAKGQDVTASLRVRLKKYASSHGIAEPIAVLATNDVAVQIEASEPAVV